MDLATLGHTWLRGLHRNMTQALMHPVLGHTLEQVTDARYPLNAFHRVLYEPFEAARRVNAFITFREFVTSDTAKALLLRLLGPDQFVLATQRAGPEYFAARMRVLLALRTSQPPIAQWMSWGHWGPGDMTVEVFDGMPRLLPVDFPVRRIAKDDTVSWGYPRWDTGRMRFHQNTSFGELLRRLPDTDVPDNLTGGALLAALKLPRDVASRPFTGMSKLRLSTLQVVQQICTGRAPPLKAVLLDPGQAPDKGFRISRGTGGRNAADARYELASRLDDTELADEATFEAAVDRQRELAEADERPAAAATNPEHPVTQLSNAELVALALDKPGAPRIAVKVWELEHHRAQRSIRALERVLYALDQVVDTSLIRHLCGLCDPHNLRLVTPEGHAALDFRAALLGKGVQFVPNGARVRKVEARRVADDTVEQVPADPLDEVAQDLVPPDWVNEAFDAHPDVQRGMNAFFGFSPYQLEPVSALLGDPGILRALQAFESKQGGQVIDSYNHLAGCVNAAMSDYGMDPRFLLRLFVDGRPL